MTRDAARPEPLDRQHQGGVMKLFGTPCWLGSDQMRPVGNDRTGQLLCFLACQGDWVTRSALASLFWPDRPERDGRSNVRNLLFRTDQERHFARLQSNGDAVRWDIESDLRRFGDACASGRWAVATRFGDDGELLTGFDSRVSQPFADWLRFERAKWADAWVNAVHRRIAEVGIGSEEGSTLARKLLERDPYDESVMAQVLTCLGLRQQFDRAERVFQSFATRMRADLGVEPSLALRSLAKELRKAGGAPAEANGFATPNTAAVRMIGRKLERAELEAWLGRPNEPLLTLIGPGGIGKSTLAWSLREHLAREGTTPVFWVSLDAALTDQGVERILGAAVPDGLDGTQAPLDAFVAHVGQRCAIVVLDGAEHVQGLARVVSELIARCPGLRLLVTSRHSVGHPAETLYPMEGLPIPDADETDAEVILSYDSAALLAARACESDPEFEPLREARSLSRLVREVEGHPLAIQLMAHRVSEMPLDEIGRIVAEDLTRLDTGDGRLTAGLATAFERSWGLLSLPEREALRELSWFKRWFDRSAVSSIAEVPLPMLFALVDKSLVVADGHGHFRVQPSVRPFVLKRALPCGAIRERHALHYARLLARYDDGDRALIALSHWRDDTVVEEGLVAIESALELGLEDELHQLLVPMWMLSFALGRLSALRPLLHRAREKYLPSWATGGRLQSQVLTALGLDWQHCCVSIAPAAELGRIGLRCALAARSAPSVIRSLVTLGWAALQAGDAGEAIRFFDHALRRCRKIGNDGWRIEVLGAMAVAWSQSAQHTRAAAALLEARGTLATLGEAPHSAFLLAQREGLSYQAQHDWPRALSAFERAWHVVSRWGVMGGRKDVLARMADMKLRLNRHDEAQTLLVEARALMRNCSNRAHHAIVACLEAEVALCKGDLVGTRSKLAELAAMPASQLAGELTPRLQSLFERWLHAAGPDASLDPAHGRLRERLRAAPAA